MNTIQFSITRQKLKTGMRDKVTYRANEHPT